MVCTITTPKTIIMARVKTRTSARSRTQGKKQGTVEVVEVVSSSSMNDEAAVAAVADEETKEDEKVVHVVVSEKDRRVRKRALALLKGEEEKGDDHEEEGGQPHTKKKEKYYKQNVELPVLYAAFKRIKEIGAWGSQTKEVDSDLTEDEQQLIEDAALAVPYAMYKRLYEHLMLPRTMGGLAFSDAKAKQLARDLFLAMGPACCSEFITDQQLSQACLSVKRIDARKILPSLKAVGREARSQVKQIEAQLNKGGEDDEEGDEDDRMDEGHEEEFAEDEQEDYIVHVDM